ncbi:MAG TPA: dTDP-4-dehydrorhamnose reductase, partial [Gammaproteobacteria bacterium]|nr:dTDP-4-dehydrorhamnose reductase [Gammaproteobacteria bacterium]
MNVIIFGARGQLGQCLADIVSSGICAEFLSREDCDLLQPDSIKRTLDKKKPDFIINAAAYTDVDRAESEAEVAHRVNGKAVGAIAEWVSYNRARLIHLSTDFVFDGKSQRPYQINDKMNPLGAYGASKEAGEKQVKELAPKATMVIRTSWVYSEYGSNFVKTMLRLMRESKSLSVVDDQLGSPTYAG